jgi:hypothetical protein
MILVLLFIFSWAVPIALFGWLYTLIGHVASVAFLRVAFPRGSSQLRGSAFACWLGYVLAPVYFTPRSKLRLEQLPPDRKVVWLVEPHGPLVLALSLLFAAYGDRLPERWRASTVVMAHRVVLLFPICAQIFQLFGVVLSREPHVESMLASGASIALCPSGWTGKELALRWDCARDGIVEKRRKLGIIRLAMKHDALIVPLWSPLEQRAYTVHTRRPVPWWMAVPWGDWMLLARERDIPVIVGEPIDPRSNEHCEVLTERFYEQVQEMAREAGSECVFQFQTSSGRSA